MLCPGLRCALCFLSHQPEHVRVSQLAAVRLGADVVHLDTTRSSLCKGETEIDTLKSMEAMGVCCFIVRHHMEGVVSELADAAAPGTVLINGGDGCNEHPTQGLLDMLTLRQAKGCDFSQLKILIVGDIKHSRVARSAIYALRILGIGEIRICGPRHLLPEAGIPGCTVTEDFDAAIEGVDAVMTLRLQRERMSKELKISTESYHQAYGLTKVRLRRAADDAIVMHPGPVNRGVEIDDDVIDGTQSLVLPQVSNGIAVRMAVLETILNRAT